MKREYLALGLMMLFGLILISVSVSAQDTQQVYRELNEIRAKKGKKPLLVSVTLEQKSQKWLEKMPSGRLIHDQWAIDAEVLTAAEDCIRAWMESPTHRKIIMSRRYKEIGIAYLDGAWCARLR